MPLILLMLSLRLCRVFYVCCFVPPVCGRSPVSREWCAVRMRGAHMLM